MRQTRRCERCLGEFWLNELERAGLRWYCRKCLAENKSLLPAGTWEKTQQKKKT